MSSPSKFTPTEKKNYWLKRIVRKANSAYGSFGREMETVVQWAHHAGMDDQERSNLAMMMADRFTAIIKKLAPKDDKQETAKKESEAPAEAETTSEADNGNN